jgi:hypothetical protein
MKYVNIFFDKNSHKCYFAKVENSQRIDWPEPDSCVVFWHFDGDKLKHIEARVQTDDVSIAMKRAKETLERHAFPHANSVFCVYAEYGDGTVNRILGPPPTVRSKGGG